MALINCPECGEKISDKSKNCIHCGYPIEQRENKDNAVNQTTPQATSQKAEEKPRYAKICSQCRYLSDLSATVCFHCGKTFAQKEEIKNLEKDLQKENKKAKVAIIGFVAYWIVDMLLSEILQHNAFPDVPFVLEIIIKIAAIIAPIVAIIAFVVYLSIHLTKGVKLNEKLKRKQPFFVSIFVAPTVEQAAR